MSKAVLKHRIKKSFEYQACKTKGKRITGLYFGVQYLIKPQGIMRLGLVVSKAYGGAVLRNRWKRKVRIVFDRMIKQKPLDMVVLARKTILKDQEQQAFDELEKLILRLTS